MGLLSWLCKDKYPCFRVNSSIKYEGIATNQKFAMYMLAQSFFDFVNKEKEDAANRILCMYQLALKLDHKDFQKGTIGGADFYIATVDTIHNIEVREEFLRICAQLRDYSDNNTAVRLYNRISHTVASSKN